MGTDMRAYFGRLSRHRCYIHGAAVHRQVSARRPAPRRPGTRLGEVVTHLLRAAPTRVGTTLRRKRESDSLDGTPPRAWGRQSDQEPEPGICRYTPTRVGTTPRYGRRGFEMAVHPQACGDDGGDARAWSRLRGTPPRAWGRLQIFLRLLRHRRYTPTRVGTTCRPPVRVSRRSVHPHAR